jgi:cytochrome c biogenesis factor
MYLFALTLHSFFRWLVLASLCYGIFNAYHGWLGKKVFQQSDNITRQVAVTMAHIQFSLGILLYFTSPLTDYFVKNFSEAVHNRGARFFGMEHITMMVIAVAMITHGSVSSKKKPGDREKFKTMAIWFSIALFIIFLSIPWPFSPFTSRPYYRSLIP